MPNVWDGLSALTAFAEVGADVLYAPHPPDMDVVRAMITMRRNSQ